MVVALVAVVAVATRGVVLYRKESASAFDNSKDTNLLAF